MLNAELVWIYLICQNGVSCISTGSRQKVLQYISLLFFNKPHKHWIFTFNVPTQKLSVKFKNRIDIQDVLRLRYLILLLHFLRHPVSIELRTFE